MISATPKILMMLLAPGVAESSLSNERTVFWLKSHRQTCIKDQWKSVERTWDNTISPGSEPSPAPSITGRYIWPVPFPPLTESPSAAAHLDCKLSHTSKALLCPGPNLKEFPLSVCQTPKMITAQDRGARRCAPQRKTLTCTHTNVYT